MGGCTSTNNLKPSTGIAPTGSSNAILKLDTQGHTAKIQNVIVTKEKKIITASDDKTIRIWNPATGKEERKILGQIGAGSEGKIYAMALSPNEQLLAVGGYFGKSNKAWGNIRIYNYPTGKLLKVLKSHTNVVQDLAFSSDGKLLISGSQDKTAKIWNMQNLTLKETIAFHKDFVYGVKLLQVNGDYRAVTAGLDNQIALYSLNRKKVIQSDAKNYKLDSLATSKEHIAVCGFNSKEIQIYDYNLNPIKTIASKTKPTGLAYSPNGAFLIAGTGTSPNNVNIYSATQDYQKTSTFQQHKNLTQAVAFLDNQTAVSAGGNNSEIYLWDRETATVKQKIEGVGETVWSVGVVGESVSWGNREKSVRNSYNNQKTLNLKTLQVSLNVPNTVHKIATTSQEGLTLMHKAGGAFGYADAILELKNQNRVMASIERGSTNGYGHRCYGFYKNMIISGASGGMLKIYNCQGREIANLLGHTGEILSIALDGDRLVSGSSDQTIKVWDLKNIESLDEMQVTAINKGGLAEQYGLKIGDIIYAIDDKKLKDINEVSIRLKQKGKYKFSIRRKNKEIDINIVRTEKKFGFTSDFHKTIYPQLNIFVSKNNEWVMWTPEGFYNASKGAEKYIGYHINQGANKEAKFLDVSRFRKQFYRSDLIQKAINGEDLSSYAKGINIDELLNAGLPPEIEILTASHNMNGDSKEIGVKICEQDGGVENLNFYIDGKAIKYLSQTKAFRNRKVVSADCSVIEQSIAIPSGKHEISFDATNKKGNILSNRPSISITNTKKVDKKPNLHLLTLSIADYKDDELDLKYPNNDAKKLSQKLKEIGKSIFGEIKTYALEDKEVTKKGIDQKIKEISPNIGVNDVFMLYISGHGITNDADGDYYFIPYDCPNGANLSEKAINQNRFKKLMSQIKAVKSVILLDTCESGSMASQDLVNTSVNRFGGNVGSAIIAGATSKEKAIDGYKEHGIFTYTLLEAMNNKKVYSFDDKLSINEVAEYAKYLLPKLAKEKFNHEQKPTIYMNGDTSFAIGGIE